MSSLPGMLALPPRAWRQTYSRSLLEGIAGILVEKMPIDSVDLVECFLEFV